MPGAPVGATVPGAPGVGREEAVSPALESTQPVLALPLRCARQAAVARGLAARAATPTPTSAADTTLSASVKAEP